MSKTLIAASFPLPALVRSLPVVRPSGYDLGRLGQDGITCLILTSDQVHGEGVDPATLTAEQVKENVTKACSRLQSAVSSYKRKHAVNMTVRTFNHPETGEKSVGVWLVPAAPAADAAPADAA